MACTNKAATIPSFPLDSLTLDYASPLVSLYWGSSGMAASSEPTLATIFEKMGLRICSVYLLSTTTSGQLAGSWPE